MITIIDYGMGNLRSVEKAVESLGYDVQISSDPEAIYSADILILPGVGAFGAAMAELNSRRLVEPIKAYVDSGKKFIGICLGMQLVLESSAESPDVKGLGFIKGQCKKFEVRPKMPVPQMGWNTVRYNENKDGVARLFDGIEQLSYFYFVHSYFVEVEDENVVAGITDYGIDYPSVLLKDNIIAAQFHPEKSQKIGLHLLKNILEY